MGADTEMSRLDSLPTEKLNELLNMEGVPKVTSSANGKVLTVVGGKWKAEEPSGGGGATVVELAYVDGVYTSTVKAGPLWEAAQAGPVIFVQKSDGTVVSVYLMNGAYKSDDAYYFYSGDLHLEAESANDYPSYTNIPT